MAEKVLLPQALGGGEAEVIERRATGYPSFMSVQRDGVVALVASEHLTPVKPPTPPEPKPGAYLIGDALAVRFEAPAEWKNCWAYECMTSKGQKDWTTDDFESMWASIGGPDVTITRLVPERVETVTLPWRGESAYGTPIRVGRERDGEVEIVIGNREIGTASAVCTPEGARELAAALRFAASRAES